MLAKQPSKLVSLQWIVDDQFRYPTSPCIAVNGYRNSKGIDDLFSVIVEFIGVEPQDIPKCTRAQLQALSDNMSDRLPGQGELFIVTAGTKPIAECRVISDIDVDEQ